jgi:hypothetical protein
VASERPELELLLSCKTAKIANHASFRITKLFKLIEKLVFVNVSPTQEYVGKGNPLPVEANKTYYLPTLFSRRENNAH